MTKKPSPGGRVQISGKQYEVAIAPRRTDNKVFRLLVRDPVTYECYWAESELWRLGKGPWKIVERATTTPA